MKIQDAMKLIAADSNKEMEEYITWALDNRLDVVKSFEEKANKGFKVFGNLVAEKRISKAVDGTQTERWVITTRFTSNKGDVTWDVTTKDAIIDAVKELDGKAIPIRFGHIEGDDYGAWTRFWTEEKDGVLYGYAEGELDQRLNKAQDLWTAIYEDGKKFATSYGARVINFEWVSKDDGETYRLLTGISFKEISLTQMPANPDTTLMEKLDKHTKDFVKSVKKEIDEKPEEEVKEKVTTEVADEVTEITSESGDEAKVEEVVAEEATEEVKPEEETSEEVEAEVAKSAEEEVATEPEEATQETEASEEKEEDQSQSLEAQNAELYEAVKALSARLDALEDANKALTEETKSMEASLKSIANSPRAFVTAESAEKKESGFEQLAELMRQV